MPTRVLAALGASLDEVGRAGPPTIRVLTTLCAGSALYGIALGSWHGSTLAFYCALKLPLLLLSTAALTLVFQWLFARLLGAPLSLRAAAGASLRALAVAAAVVGGLTPVAWLFIAAVPPPGIAARTTHNLLYVTHTALLAVAGFCGASRLRRHLFACARSPGAARAAFVAWIVSFALVAGEMGWVLRPFVGSVFQPTTFLRANALEGNVYEFIWTDVLPQLRSELRRASNERSRR